MFLDSSHSDQSRLFSLACPLWILLSFVPLFPVAPFPLFLPCLFLLFHTHIHILTHTHSLLLCSSPCILLLAVCSDLRALQGFTNLHTLVLDSNQLTSHVAFPQLPHLETLWINDNKISNLSLFVVTLSSMFPNLKFLSMMKNEAAPSYFNGGSLQDYQEYRLAVDTV